MRVEVFSALCGLDAIPIHEYVCVVIDVLRASTTVLCLMEHGAQYVRIVATVEEALALKPEGYVLVGERGDEPVPGFDYDNSPFAVSQASWQGKKVALTTTNGTRALMAARNGREVLVGGFRNVDTVAAYLRKRDRPVALLPAGHLGTPTVEDELCAQALQARIGGQPVDYRAIAREVWAEQAATLRRRGERYRGDIELALAPNATSIIPVLARGLVLTRTEPATTAMETHCPGGRPWRP